MKKMASGNANTATGVILLERPAGAPFTGGSPVQEEGCCGAFSLE